MSERKKVEPFKSAEVPKEDQSNRYHGRGLSWQPLSHYFCMAERHLPHTPAMIWGQPNHRLQPLARLWTVGIILRWSVVKFTVGSISTTISKYSIENQHINCLLNKKSTSFSIYRELITWIVLWIHKNIVIKINLTFIISNFLICNKFKKCLLIAYLNKWRSELIFKILLRLYLRIYARHLELIFSIAIFYILRRLKSAASSASRLRKVRDALSRQDGKSVPRRSLKFMRWKIGRTISRSIIFAGDIIKPLGPPSSSPMTLSLHYRHHHRIQNFKVGGRDEMARLPSESLLSISFPSSCSSIPPSRLAPHRATRPH